MPVPIIFRISKSFKYLFRNKIEGFRNEILCAGRKDAWNGLKNFKMQQSIYAKLYCKAMDVIS